MLREDVVTALVEHVHFVTPQDHYLVAGIVALETDRAVTFKQLFADESLQRSLQSEMSSFDACPHHLIVANILDSWIARLLSDDAE